MPLCVLTRLVWSRLWHRELAPFGAMLLVGLCRDLGLLLPAYTTHAYTVAWEATLPMLLAAQAVAAIGLYRAIAKLYPRIGRFAVYLFAGALGLTACACVGLLPAELGHMTTREAVLRTAFLLQRWIASELAGGLLLAVLFLSRFPCPVRRLPRNLVWHASLLTTYFTLTAALMLFENLAPLGAQAVLEQCEFAAVIGLYVAWTFALSPGGERSELWQPVEPGVIAAAVERERATCALYLGTAK